MYDRYYPYLYNRSEKPLPPPPKPANPQNLKKKKICFKTLKKDACSSLCDVEYFLNNFSHTIKYIRLINILK